MQRRQRQKRMVEIVAGENGNRPLGRKTAIDQRLCDPPRSLQRLRVAEAPPPTSALAGRDEGSIGRNGRPERKPFGQTVRIVRQVAA
jgi:hypothetical protein